MGRTEFPDLKLIESEPWLDTALFLIERNGALRSARISTLKKNLTSAGIVRDACSEQLSPRCRSQRFRDLGTPVDFGIDFARER
jgi:hypothetical protein